MDKKLLKVYLVTDNKALKGRDFFDVVEDALKGGVTIVQLREKELSDEEFIAKALKLKELTKKYNVPLIINDNIAVAKAVDADGVHIGQKDMDYIEARKLLGDDKIIGMTAPSVELAKKAEKLGADYIGAGAVFNTSTKKDTKPLELSTLKEICSSISIPVVAIGGIDHSNVRKLKGTDIDGVAVISALFGASDPGEATRELVSIMKDIIK